MIQPTSSLDELAKRVGGEWVHLRDARELAVRTRRELRKALEGLDSEDTSIIVSGSLARDEYTASSDIDWTLLIDGSADPKHYDLFGQVDTVMSGFAAKPAGREGTFEAMVFSHDLVHEIGGENDTNRNLTRRLLLLLESQVVGREDAYRRVVRSVLDRYLLEDRGLWRGSGHRVPRFLQNDFARYWRTMAVDFAYKLRKRSGKGWAIRNIKLRMSRKLIYVSGLLACYCCHLDYTPHQRRRLFNSTDGQKEIVEHMEAIFRMTPLEIVANVLLRYPHLDNAARKILDSYDEFVGTLADEGKRAHLENLIEDKTDSDEIYQRVRQLSHVFREGLIDFFFDPNSDLDTLTKNYGVF
ncbi:MAG TPA: nucleotidyltransferase domain-containing protein [Bryobacteraceae bacterium]|nr:nucleotidyltransferase domain-containing protein [Bryobacteraceae bacterium]